MRKPFIVANWKMNKNVHESVAFVREIVDQLPKTVEVGIAAQAVSLYNMKQATRGSSLQIIAQNASAQNDGPYTGEISLRTLKDAGATYVMLGHLERRRLFNEGNAMINQKVLAALRMGITPIICTDEEMVQAEVNGEIGYVFQQLRQTLSGVRPDQLAQIVISYEPSWAIGSRQNANPDIAEEGCRQIRQSLADNYSYDVADQVRILYGGSVNADNIQEIMKKPNVDGALIGRASLDVNNFREMINYQQILEPKIQVV